MVETMPTPRLDINEAEFTQQLVADGEDAKDLAKKLGVRVQELEESLLRYDRQPVVP